MMKNAALLRILVELFSFHSTLCCARRREKSSNCDGKKKMCFNLISFIFFGHKFTVALETTKLIHFLCVIGGIASTLANTFRIRQKKTFYLSKQKSLLEEKQLNEKKKKNVMM